MALAFPVVVMGFILIPPLIRAKHAAAIVITVDSLKAAYVALKQDDRFTNIAPQICHIYEYTNRYSVSGKVYQCEFAADAWDHRAHDNLLAITTNYEFLFIDKKGVVVLDLRNVWWKEKVEY